MAKTKTAFTNLTWEDLQEWAGRKVVARGKSYKQQVEDLCAMPDGGAVAWVQGTDRYATRVWLAQDPSSQTGLRALCSCPYAEGPCKHAVAIILVVLDALKSKRELASAKEGDRRLKILKSVEAGGNDSEDETDDDDEEDWEDEDSDDLIHLDSNAEARGLKRRDAGAMKRPQGRPKSESAKQRILREHFEAMSREDLVAFALEQARDHDEIGRAIIEKAQLAGGKVRKLVASLREEIKTLARQPAWINSWTGAGERPDYGHVHSQMTALLEAGHADEVVSLGKDLWRLGNRQIGQSNDEGETAGEIGRCMDVVLLAIQQSALAASERLLLIIDTCLADDYSCLSKTWHVQDKDFNREAWGQAANTLEGRLAELPVPTVKDDFSAKYRRDHLLRWIIKTFEGAGRRRDIIPLLEREAPATLCYEDLVKRLRHARQETEARRWAVQGFAATVAKWPGIAWKLEEQLREMAEAKHEWAAVAAYRAFEFFDLPSLHRFVVLQQATDRAKAWEAVRTGVLQYLEDGVRPDLAQPPSRKKHRAVTAWPLPTLEVQLALLPRRDGIRSETETLIDIAIHEKRNEEVVRHYQNSRSHLRGPGGRAATVADAVQESHPDVALDIWRQLMEAEINTHKPVVYEQAVRWLRPMRAVYEKNGLAKDWQVYLQDLRVRHKAKRSLIAALDKLEGIQRPPKRIIDT